MRTLSALFALCLLSMAGCNPSSSTAPETAKASEVAPFESFSLNLSSVSSDAESSSTTSEAIRAATRIVNSDEHGAVRLSPIYEPGVSLKTRDAEATRLLGLADDGVQGSVIRQMVAIPMLQHHVNAPQQDMGAVERYTELALTENSTDAMTLAAALKSLEGIWSSERVARAARRASESAQMWIQEECLDCSRRSAQDLGIETDRSKLNQFSRAIEGITELEGLM